MQAYDEVTTIISQAILNPNYQARNADFRPKKSMLELVQLAKQGVSLRIDANERSTFDLMQIIKAVLPSGGHLVLYNLSGKSNVELLQLSAIGAKQLTLEF